ncbi:MAK10-like protein [Tanacetum coccineum]
MGDENPIRTLGDYSKPSHEGYMNTIELPIGNNVALLEDLALYDNESSNDPRDFAKPVKAIALPQDVPSTSDRRLIELKNQVQSLMEVHLAPTQPTQVNKVTTSCEIYSGPHDTQYCMEDPEQAFIEYGSLRIDESGEGLVSNFMASQDARLFTFEADLKQQQSEMTNKIDTVLKVITDRIAGALPSDTVKNPKLSTSLVLSARSYPTMDPQCSTHVHGSINAVTIHPKQQSDSHDDRSEENEEEEKVSPENIDVDPSTPPDPSVLFITEKDLKLNSFFESLRLVPLSSCTELVCTKRDDDDVMFIEIVKKYDDSHEEEPEAGEHEVEYFNIFSTRSELAYHKYLMCGPIPSIFLRNPIIIEGCPSNLKIPCNIRHVHVEKAYTDPNSPLNIMTQMMYNWIMRRKFDPRENSNRGVSNFTGRINGMHVFVGNFTYILDFMIVEDISSIIDHRLSQVVLGKPFVKISNMTHDPPEGVVRFINGTDEGAYKMPHKIEQYNSLLYLTRKSLEVLRKFHLMTLGGRFNQLSHVSSPLLSKPGEYFNNSLSGARVGKIKGRTYNLLPRGPVYEAILRKKITRKEDIEGNFEIPYNIGGLKHMNALVDKVSDVNVMPLSTNVKLIDERHAETDIRLSLDSHLYIYPLAIVEDVLVEVAEHVYPIDFVILDIKENEKRPFILGTPFLTTAKAVIKFDKGTITLRYGKNKISFNPFHGDGVTCIKRHRRDLSGDDVWILVTASQRFRKPAFVCIAVDTSREMRVRRKDTIGNPTAANNQRTLTCFECGNQGHYRSDCPELKNQNRGNQSGNGEACGRVYALGGG